jgi:hypothetical protein
MAEKLLLDEDIYKYHYVSQGKITIPGMDDAEEARATDVSIPTNQPNDSLHSSPAHRPRLTHQLPLMSYNVS